MSNTDEIYAAATPTPWAEEEDGGIEVHGDVIAGPDGKWIVDTAPVHDESDAPWSTVVANAALIVYAVNNFRRVKAERDQALAEAALLESEAVRAHEDFVDLAGKHEALKVASRALLLGFHAGFKFGSSTINVRVKALEELL